MRTAQAPPAAEKRPFDIDEVFARIREAVRPYPKAALFELAEEGHGSPFEILVACILSVRTRDETTLPAARRLFEAARTPAALLRLDPAELAARLRGCAFAEAKARQLRELARRLEAEHGGELPCDRALLLSLPGVGPKCAHLTLGIACGEAWIAVDVHVHRVTNRWGYVHARTPEETLRQLEAKLPRRYWIEINRLLVPFGKHLCTGRLPKCSICPVLEMCRQVGVTSHR